MTPTVCCLAGPDLGHPYQNQAPDTVQMKELGPMGNFARHDRVCPFLGAAGHLVRGNRTLRSLSTLLFLIDRASASSIDLWNRDKGCGTEILEILPFVMVFFNLVNHCFPLWSEKERDSRGGA